MIRVCGFDSHRGLSWLARIVTVDWEWYLSVFSAAVAGSFDSPPWNGGFELANATNFHFHNT